MDNVVPTINFIRSTSSLQHRLFCKLLSEMSAEHHDLLLHNDIRWLSKGKALEHFCDLREEIVTFLHSSKQKKAEGHLKSVLDDSLTADVCFLSDIFKHLNNLNVGLQGRDKTVIDLVEQMHTFQVKLDLIVTDLSTGRFAGRLDGLALLTEVMGYARDPFTVAIEGGLSARAKEVVPSIDEGKFTLELVDMQSSVTMAQELRSNRPARFWSDIN